MTGAIGASGAIAGQNAVFGGGGTGGGGGVVPTPAPAWTAIYGEDFGSTNNQTIAGIGSTISLTASRSGGGILGYTLNGSSYTYTGAVTVHVGDALAWTIAVGALDKSGTITVINASNGGATLATIAYVVTSSGGGGFR